MNNIRMFIKTIVQNYNCKARKLKPYSKKYGKYCIVKNKRTFDKKLAAKNANRYLKKAYRNMLKKDLFQQLNEI